MSAVLPVEAAEGPRRRFLDRVVRPVLAAAEARAAKVALTVSIAGALIRFEFLGAALAERLSRGLAHNAVADDGRATDLVIHVWDSASLGLPPPAYHLPAEAAEGLVAAPEPGLVAGFVNLEETLSLLDLERGEAYFWLPDCATMPGWIAAAPMRRLLQWFFLGRGVHLMHGAAIGRPEGTLLVTARGGSGKSTTAVAAAAGGLSFLGDDYVAVENGAPPLVHSLYNSAKLMEASLAMLPDCRAFIRETDVGDRLKSVLFMSEALPDCLLLSAPLKAIAVPVINRSERTHFVPVDRKTTLLALAPSSMLHVSLKGGPELMRALGTLVGSLPCYRLMLGREPDEIAAGIAAFLDRPS